jgi:hypothetical protein
VNALLTVNPFRPFVRFAAALWRCRPQPAQSIPVERPPRGAEPHTRTRVVWGGGQLHPFPLTITEPGREEPWRR